MDSWIKCGFAVAASAAAGAIAYCWYASPTKRTGLSQPQSLDSIAELESVTVEELEPASDNAAVKLPVSLDANADEPNEVAAAIVVSKISPTAAFEPMEVPATSVEPLEVPDISVELLEVSTIAVESSDVPAFTVEPPEVPAIAVESPKVPAITVEPIGIPAMDVEPMEVPEIAIELSKAQKALRAKELYKDQPAAIRRKVRRRRRAPKKTDNASSVDTEVNSLVDQEGSLADGEVLDDHEESPVASGLCSSFNTETTLVIPEESVGVCRTIEVRRRASEKSEDNSFDAPEERLVPPEVGPDNLEVSDTVTPETGLVEPDADGSDVRKVRKRRGRRAPKKSDEVSAVPPEETFAHPEVGPDNLEASDSVTPETGLVEPDADGTDVRKVRKRRGKRAPKKSEDMSTAPPYENFVDPAVDPEIVEVDTAATLEIGLVEPDGEGSQSPKKTRNKKGHRLWDLPIWQYVLANHSEEEVADPVKYDREQYKCQVIEQQNIDTDSNCLESNVEKGVEQSPRNWADYFDSLKKSFMEKSTARTESIDSSNCLESNVEKGVDQPPRNSADYFSSLKKSLMDKSTARTESINSTASPVDNLDETEKMDSSVASVEIGGEASVVRKVRRQRGKRSPKKNESSANTPTAA